MSLEEHNNNQTELTEKSDQTDLPAKSNRPELSEKNLEKFTFFAVGVVFTFYVLVCALAIAAMIKSVKNPEYSNRIEFEIEGKRDNKIMKNPVISRKLIKDLKQNQKTYKEICTAVFFQYFKAMSGKQYTKALNLSCQPSVYEIPEKVCIIYGNLFQNITNQVLIPNNCERLQLEIVELSTKKDKFFSELYLDMTEEIEIEVIDMRKASKEDLAVLERGVDPSVCGFFPELSEVADHHLDGPSLVETMRRLKVTAYPYYFTLGDLHGRSYRCTFLRLAGTNEFVFFRISEKRFP